MMALIEMQAVNKIYNQNSKNSVHALKNVDLTINSGELLAITGTSGSGKSTLLHILSCIDSQFDGNYFFDSVNVKNLSSKEISHIRNQKIGIVLQHFGLIPNMTVFDNIAIPLHLDTRKHNKSDIQKEISQLLENLKMTDKMHTKVKHLSGGQMQRVAIARALINHPKLILADEPTGALDEKTSMEIMTVLQELNQNNHTIVIVTHDMNVAKYCNRIITISDGLLNESDSYI